jgi:hypothetical protein
VRLELEMGLRLSSLYKPRKRIEEKRREEKSRRIELEMEMEMVWTR